MKTRWEKPYRGPFGRKEAEALVSDLKKIADPEKNLIHDVKIRIRPKTKMYAERFQMYDVYVKSEVL